MALHLPIFNIRLQTHLEGNVVGNIFENEPFMPLRLVYPGSRKHRAVDDIKQLQIFLPDGRLKPISELATIKLNAGDAEIQRENLAIHGCCDLHGLKTVTLEV